MKLDDELDIPRTQLNQIKKMVNVMVAQGDGEFSDLYKEAVRRYSKGWITDRHLSTIDKYESPFAMFAGDYSLILSRRPSRNDLRAIKKAIKKGRVRFSDET